MGKIVDITGQKFGRLTAVVKTGRKNYKNGNIWLFVCDCGNTRESDSYPATSGKMWSCGCENKKVEIGEKSRTHGMTGKPEWISWQRAKMRTSAPSSDGTKYQREGIKMSEEFADSFEVFLAHIGPMPTDGKKYSLGRIENTGHYERGNVQWEDDFQQARNKGKFASNTSGVTGVLWCNKKNRKGVGYLYATAHWSDPSDSKVKSKNFSVQTFGLLPAFAMACEYREKMIANLNKQGAGYSPSHGK